MITVHTLPSIEPNAREGWDLILWVGSPADYDTPFRDIITEVAQVLGCDPAGSIDLPPCEYMEDFVEGYLKCGSHAFGIYFEHSLGYLNFYSGDRSALEDLKDRLDSVVSLDQSVFYGR